MSEDLTREEKEALLLALKEKEDRVKYNYIKTLFPDEGPILPGCLKSIARENYPKAIEFIAAGNTHTERAYIAGNRCFTYDTEVMMFDGTRKLIKDVKIGDFVAAYDKKTDTIKTSKVIDTFKGHADNLIEVNISKEDTVKCTDDHPFMAFNTRGNHKLKPIKDILKTKYHSKVIIASKWKPETVTPNFNPDIARLIGYLIGDGCLTREYCQFTNTRQQYIDDVKQICEKNNLILRNKGYGSFRLSKANGKKSENYIINILKDLKLWGTRSGTKFIPKELLVAPIEYVNELLKGLIATDGCMTKGKFQYFTSSQQLAKDLRTLLLRLNIDSTLHRRKYKNPNHNDSFIVQVSNKTGLLKLPTVLCKPLKLNDSKTDRQHISEYPCRNIRFKNTVKAQDIYCITIEHHDHTFIVNNCFLVSNTGKTLTGLYELVTHCIGDYPDWWPGKKFDRPVYCWLVGDRGDSIRDSMQRELVGLQGLGTGLIPKDAIAREPSALQGTAGAYGTYYIKHKSGGVSTIIVKTYNAGQAAFEAAKVDVAMLDEECPLPIYVEVLMRVMTTNGTVYLTFTPDSGLTDTVLHFYEKPKDGSQPRFVVNVGWSDVPHLSEDSKKKMIDALPPHLVAVKTKGIPYLGTGAIYPIPEDDITCEPFEIPFYWPRAYALDPSWGRTAAVWGAYNEREDIWYIYSEYVRGQAELPIHVDAIKARGSWIPGVVDPYALGGGRGKDGEAFFEAYVKHGLNLEIANNAVEAGIQEVYQRLSTGRLKIFRTMQNFFYEYRMYRRDDKGKIVKKNDDELDAVRYLIMSGVDVALPEPTDEKRKRRSNYSDPSISNITGY